MLMAGEAGRMQFHNTGFGPSPDDRAYLPGKQLARSYEESTLPALCSNVKLVSDAEREDIEKNPVGKGAGLSGYDAGEVVFSCARRSATLVAPRTAFMG